VWDSSPEVELLFVALGGTIIGGLTRYLLPGRLSHGAMLLPAIGTVAAMILWSALTWAGWQFDGGWIWFVSLLAAAASSATAGLFLPRRRREADARLLSRLNRP
jgi:hypothetical protein